MTRLAAPVWLGHEFNNFLFATIGEDRHGLMLNVVSVLGRSNLDPWEEAASLARLPKELATQRLALLLDALPDPALQQGTDIVANRLIELLPQQVKPKVRTSTLTLGAGATTHPRVLVQVLLVGIYMLCLLGTELVVSHFKSTHINTTHASDASMPAVQMPPAPNHEQQQ